MDKNSMNNLPLLILIYTTKSTKPICYSNNMLLFILNPFEYKGNGFLFFAHHS